MFERFSKTLTACVMLVLLCCSIVFAFYHLSIFRYSFNNKAVGFTSHFDLDGAK